MVARPGCHKQPCGKFDLNSWPARMRFATPAALQDSCTRDLRRAGAALKQLVCVPGGPGWLARDTVLANGGQLPPGTLVRRFLGRGSNAKAFFEKLER